jgi:hypothetical protein
VSKTGANARMTPRAHTTCRRDTEPEGTDDAREQERPRHAKRTTTEGPTVTGAPEPTAEALAAAHDVADQLRRLVGEPAAADSDSRTLREVTRLVGTIRALAGELPGVRETTGSVLSDAARAFGRSRLDHPEADVALAALLHDCASLISLFRRAPGAMGGLTRA